MKILAIRGRNLASLEGEFTVNFSVEPLLSAGIFAISGPTGAGKSTLLDAMCLALFAKTPRTVQAKENKVDIKDIHEDTLPQGDPRFLLRRGTGAGYAEADFLAMNGHRYRARWTISRAREKENGRLQDYRITLHNLDTGEEEQGKRSELQARIVELIGLTYEQFTRSVLLAQNDFATFLKAEQSEKASLLEKLTGTEQYSAISRLIFEKNGEAREAFEQVRLRIAGIELLSEEEEAAARTASGETEKELKQLETWKAERQKITGTITTAEKGIADKQTQLQKAANDLNKANGLLATASKSYEEAEQKHRQAEQEYKAIQPDIKEARKLDTQLDADRKASEDAKATLKKAQDEQARNEAKLKQVADKQKKTAEGIAGLTAWIEKFKAKESIAEQLPLLLVHLDRASQALQAKDNAIAKKEKLVKQINDRLSTIAAYGYRGTDEASVKLTIDQRQAEREKLVVEQTRFATSGSVKTLRDKLMEGTPCPVCGSTIHPYASAQVISYFVEIGNKIDALEKEITKLKRLGELAAEKNKLAANLPHEEEEIAKQEALLENALLATNKLFGHDEWQANWRQDAAGFVTKLKAFAAEWKQNKEELQQLQKEQIALEPERKSYAAFTETLQQRTTEALTVAGEKSKLFEEHTAARTQLLKGKTADTIEKELTGRIDAAQKQLKELLDVKTEQSRIAEQSKGSVEQITQDLKGMSEALANHRKALEEWTAAYQAASEEAAPLDERLKQQTQKQNEYTFRLRKQEENKRKVAALQDELNSKQAVSEQWGKLNDLAGSADGAKFRRIAQCYTLDVLLNDANVQLRSLAPRYYLERVPDTLALQVIDRDMCDEVRTVHSLSGGESFLVSLALALGLSSLSSNRMKVESLFIDEGFGSLDAETLRIALDALENLRTQGRKIGVISHVQEMTERIQAQIKVCPAGNGRSYIA